MATFGTWGHRLVVLTSLVLLGGCAATATSTPTATAALTTPAPTTVSPPSPGDTSVTVPAASRSPVVEAEHVSCPPGSTPDKPGPVAQARPPMSYVAPMAFDRRAGRIVLLAGDGPGFGETWTFDVCANTWTQMHPNRQPSAWSTLVYDVDSDVTIAFDRRNAWAYDLVGKTWTMKAGVSIGLAGYPRLVYDPVTGLVVMALVQGDLATNPSGLWTYDVETDTWTAIAQVGPSEIGRFGGHAVVAYDGAVDRLVFYEPGVGTALFDLPTRAWSRSRAAAPNVMFGWGPSGGEIVYDGAMKRTIVSSYGRVIAYDAAADSWEVLVGGWVPDGSPFSGPTCRSMPWIVYDPIDDRLVVYGGQYPTGDPPTETSSGWVQSDDVLAFDPATRDWTVLLAASKVQPPPP